ncbi:iron-sulfur cluster assembly accessory protein [bacterium]|jgi:iron-sulfur cluster assembly protein|nr:iron-sulfur cluster assembly accessory protein [bacterium]MDB4413009.1 iron-sulfur cluster assembly accessory protein [Pirellulaceae bacterium]MDC0296900.1 iron-sulfur cluster assembly accessory protein [bacterium]
MSIVLTEKAAKEVMRAMEDHAQDDAAMLRIGVKGGGCSGFQYALDFVSNSDEDADTKIEQHGVTVVVDKKSLMYLEGTTLDYYESIEHRGFTFDNPNVTKSCGCGSSFQA